MDAELRRRVDALRRPLELAAADNFAGVRKVAGLGHALRAGCDGILARLEDKTALEQWRATLARWETLDETQQAVEVARGMRLIAKFPRPAAPPAAPRRLDMRAAPVPKTPPLPAPHSPPPHSRSAPPPETAPTPTNASQRDVLDAEMANALADATRAFVRPIEPATTAPKPAAPKPARVSVRSAG